MKGILIDFYADDTGEEVPRMETFDYLGPEDFKEGELVIYQNGDSFEVGRIKRLERHAAYVWYHEGQTAAATPYSCLRKIRNAYAIKDTLGRCE